MIIAISGKMKSGKDTVAKMLQYLFCSPDYSLEEWLSEEPLHGLYTQKQLRQEGSGWTVKKFADPIKDTVCNVVGCTREELEDQEFKTSSLGSEWDNMTPRQMMQQIGEYMAKEVHPDIWVNALFSDYQKPVNEYQTGEKSLGKLPKWIISDLRFPNELRRIKKHKHFLVRVNRKTEVRFPVIWREFQNSGYQDWEKFLKSRHRNFYESLYHTSEISLDHLTNKDWDFVIENNGSLERLFNEVEKIYNQLWKKKNIQ